MPIWLIPAILAAAGGLFFYEKRQALKTSAGGSDPNSPKAQYNQGFADGQKAGTADAASKKPSTVSMTVDQLNQIFKNPSMWMNDPKQAYTLGYGLGYHSTYDSATIVPPPPPPTSEGSGSGGMPGMGSIGMLPIDPKKTTSTPAGPWHLPSIQFALSNPTIAAKLASVQMNVSHDDAYKAGFRSGQDIAVRVISAYKDILPSDLQPNPLWSDDAKSAWNQGYADGYTQKYASFLPTFTATGWSQPVNTDDAYGLGLKYGLRFAYARSAGLPDPFLPVAGAGSTIDNWDADILASYKQGMSDGASTSVSATPVCGSGYQFDVNSGTCKPTGPVRAEAPSAVHGMQVKVSNPIEQKISPEWRSQIAPWFLNGKNYG